jgi:hypothetical protein
MEIRSTVDISSGSIGNCQISNGPEYAKALVKKLDEVDSEQNGAGGT